MKDGEPLIPKHGGYRKLKSYEVALLVYDVTVRFCDKYIDKRSRTHDQMVQAARSGVQNIAEGSQVSGTSKKSEMKLTSVARGSLEELKGDYETFLRQRSLPIWHRNDPRRESLIALRPKSADAVAQWAKQIHDQPAPTSPSTKSTVSTKSTSSTPSTVSTKSTSSTPSTYPEIAANAALALVAVACALLDRQLDAQSEAFKHEGGFTERLYHKRKDWRDTGR